MSWEGISLEEAQQRAKDRRLVVLVEAAWCSMCHELRREVLDTPAGRIFDGSIRVDVDFDAPEGRAWVKRFAVLELPTVLLLDGDVEVGRAVGFEDRESWLDEAREALAANDPMPTLRAAHEGDPTNPEAALAFGEASLSRAPDEGLSVLEAVSFRDDDHGAFALWLLGRYHHRVLDDPSTARFVWQQLAARFPESSHARDAWWWYANAQAARGHAELGSAALEARVRRDPSDAGAVAEWARFAGREGLEEVRDAVRAAAMRALGSARGRARDDLEDLVMGLGAPFVRGPG